MMTKDFWKIRDLIEAAEVVLALAREGFTTLPSCQSQAVKLKDCCKKLGEDFASGWVAAWDKVTNTLAPKFITANSISETLGFTMTKSRITLPNYLRERLRESASDRGLSIKEMLEEDYGITEPIEGEDTEAGAVENPDDRVEEVSAEAMAIWEADLEELVKEHDATNWLMATLFKLANLVPKPKSSFNFLLEHKRSLSHA